MPSGTAKAPPNNTVLYQYTSGKQTWKTWLGGPGVHESHGLSASPDMNGDLVYSESAGLYGAYFVITDYSGVASGHFGDSVEYVSTNGTLETIAGASSAWGCSHNTGIAFEAADNPPFASICAEDQGAIWLNTKTQGMTVDGVKISNENTTNGGSGEPMGGMSGSYSALTRFAETTKYIFAWVSRGAIDVTENSWMGSGYTNVQNRTNVRNVAIALFSDKYTKVGAQATSEVGAEYGDLHINWLTSDSNDCSNAHAATFGSDNALVTWEEISDPICDFVAMGCRGQFAGTHFQQVDSAGSKVGDSFSRSDVYVAGDMVTMEDGRICWPYVSMTWDLSQAINDASSSGSTKKLSIACMSLEVADSESSSTSSGSTTSAITEDVLSQTIGDTTSQTTANAPSETTSQGTSGTVATLPGGTDGDESSGTVTEASSVASNHIQSSTASASSGSAAGTIASETNSNAPISSSTDIPSNTPGAIDTGAPNYGPDNPWGMFPSGAFHPTLSGVPSGFPRGHGKGHGRGHGRGCGRFHERQPQGA